MSSHRIMPTLCFVFALATVTAAVPALERQSSSRILAATGVKGGLIVHLGCGDGKLTAALCASDSYLVHGLGHDATSLTQARKYIREQQLYGRVSVMQWSGAHLPYAENMVSLLIAEQPLPVSMNEVMRVLRPLGVAYVKSGDKWIKTTKPWPDEIDEWTHWQHSADGNAVARGKAARKNRFCRRKFRGRKKQLVILREMC